MPWTYFEIWRRRNHCNNLLLHTLFGGTRSDGSRNMIEERVTWKRKLTMNWVDYWKHSTFWTYMTQPIDLSDRTVLNVATARCASNLLTQIMPGLSFEKIAGGAPQPAPWWPPAPLNTKSIESAFQYPFQKSGASVKNFEGPGSPHWFFLKGFAVADAN